MRNGNTWNLSVKGALAGLVGQSILGQTGEGCVDQGLALVPAGRSAEGQLVQFRRSDGREARRRPGSNVVEALRLVRSCDRMESLALGVLMLAGIVMFGLFLAGRFFGS